MPKCIYCRHEDNSFDREHVIPEAFGTFDSRRYRQTNGHLITFDWNYGQTGFLAQVSLFNSIT